MIEILKNRHCPACTTGILTSIKVGNNTYNILCNVCKIHFKNIHDPNSIYPGDKS